MTRDTAEIRTTSNAPHVLSVTLEDQGHQLLGVIEANLKLTSAYRKGVLDHILEEAAGKLQRPLTRLSADELGECIAEAIMFDAQRWRDVGAVFYAGVVTTANEVHVCTAGDLRVHLLIDGLTSQRTRDHNAVEDDERGEYRGHFDGMPRLLFEVPTRALPATGEKKPESVTWRFRRPAMVLVCSSQVHLYRDPNEYVPELLRQPPDVPALGFLAVMSLR